MWFVTVLSSASISSISVNQWRGTLDSTCFGMQKALYSLDFAYFCSWTKLDFVSLCSCRIYESLSLPEEGPEYKLPCLLAQFIMLVDFVILFTEVWLNFWRQKIDEEVLGFRGVLTKSGRPEFMGFFIEVKSPIDVWVVFIGD